VGTAEGVQREVEAGARSGAVHRKCQAIQLILSNSIDCL
jgi:hypothetical protein